MKHDGAEIAAIVLRFRDLVTGRGETIARHRDKCDQFGFTWWGWWQRAGEVVPYATFVRMKFLLVTGGSFRVFLFDTATDSLYEAQCDDVQFAATGSTTLLSPQPEATPDYYNRRQYLAWFKFRSISKDPIEESQVIDHYSYTVVPEFTIEPKKKDARFNKKVVASVREMHSQSRTVFFLRASEPSHSRREIVDVPKLQVFLCHASDDKERVRELYKQLIADSVSPWLDEENLLPGQDWEFEILKAVKESHVVLVCLSASSVTKEGFVRKEINFALNVAEQKPESTIFIIPARLEPCGLPPRLSHLQCVNLYQAGGYQKLVEALSLRAKGLAERSRR